MMYEKPRENVKVEPRSTFTFTRGFSYINSILIYARTVSWSLRPYPRKNYATVEIHLHFLPRNKALLDGVGNWIGDDFD